MADTPWRGRPAVRPGSNTQNASAQRKARDRMSYSELQTGRSDEEWQAFHEAQRAGVRRRFLGEGLRDRFGRQP